MDLLRLPPETFSNVMYQYIMTYGVQAALMLLTVCGAFRNTIMFNLLTRVPPKMFRAREGREFLNMNLAAILAARTYQAHRRTNLYGMQSFLPEYLIQIVGEIYKIPRKVTDGVTGRVSFISRQVGDRVRRQHEATIAQALVLYWENARYRRKGKIVDVLVQTSDSDKNRRLIKEFNDTAPSAVIAAAVAIGDLGALEVLRMHDKVAMWRPSSAFGTPFYMAVLFDRAELVLAALNDLVSAPRNIANYVEQALWDAFIFFVKHQRHQDLALAILNLRPAFFPNVDAWTFKMLRTLIITHGNDVLMGALFRFASLTSKKWLIGALEEDCLEGLTGRIGMFFDPEVLGINQCVFRYGINQYPLEIALEHTRSDDSCDQIVAIMLHHGANPNGVSGGTRRTPFTPLSLAVQDNYWSTAKRLIRNNADVLEWAAVAEILRFPQQLRLHYAKEMAKNHRKLITHCAKEPQSPEWREVKNAFSQYPDSPFSVLLLKTLRIEYPMNGELALQSYSLERRGVSLMDIPGLPAAPEFMMTRLEESGFSGAYESIFSMPAPLEFRVSVRDVGSTPAPGPYNQD